MLLGKGLGPFLATLGRMNRSQLLRLSTRSTSGSSSFGIAVTHGPSALVWALLLLVCSLGGVRQAEAQRMAARSVEELAGELRTSVLRSDVSDLMPRAAETIEIELFGKRRYYSRGQAMLILNGLLEDARPTAVQITRSHRTPSAAFIEATVSSSESGSKSVWLARYGLLRGEWRMRELRVGEADE